MKRRRVRLAACGTNSLRSSSANASGSPHENCYASSVFEKERYIYPYATTRHIDRSRLGQPRALQLGARLARERAVQRRDVEPVHGVASAAQPCGGPCARDRRDVALLVEARDRYYKLLGDQALTRHAISRSCLVEIGATRVTRYYKLRRVQILTRHVISRSRLVKVACIRYYSCLRDQIHTQHVISRSCLVEPLAMEPLVLVLVGRHAAVLTVPRRGVGAARWLDAVAGVSSGVVALRHVRGAHIHPRMTELFAVVEEGGSAGGEGGGGEHICACRGLAQAAAAWRMPRQSPQRRASPRQAPMCVYLPAENTPCARHAASARAHHVVEQHKADEAEPRLVGRRDRDRRRVGRRGRGRGRGVLRGGREDLAALRLVLADAARVEAAVLEVAPRAREGRRTHALGRPARRARRGRI